MPLREVATHVYTFLSRLLVTFVRVKFWLVRPGGRTSVLFVYQAYETSFSPSNT